MEIKFEINKELQYKQLRWYNFEGKYNKESWCIIYLIKTTVIIK